LQDSHFERSKQQAEIAEGKNPRKEVENERKEKESIPKTSPPLLPPLSMAPDASKLTGAV
jgi:hypothetical protein